MVTLTLSLLEPVGLRAGLLYQRGSLPHKATAHANPVTRIVLSTCLSMPLFDPTHDLDASEIAHGLWQGSFPPTGFVVRDNGFQVLVLCARELQPLGSLFLDVEVISAPNDDFPNVPVTEPKLRVAVTAARRVATEVQQEKKVLVTCAAGMNRSGFVSALALHFLFGWSGDQCIKHVRQRRGNQNGFTPLFNPKFVKLLRRLPNREPQQFGITT